MTHALSASVLSIDASRRVGWAKAFAAEGSRDEMARDLNVARADAAIYAKFAGFMYGAMTVLYPGLINHLPKGIDRTHLMSALPAMSINAGRRAAQKVAKPVRGKPKVLVRTGCQDCPWREHARLWEARAKGKQNGR